MAGAAAHIDDGLPGELGVPGELIGGVLGQTRVKDVRLCLFEPEQPEQANRPGETLAGLSAGLSGLFEPSRGVACGVRAGQGLLARL